jgi:hypothetical protein
MLRRKKNSQLLQFHFIAGCKLFTWLMTQPQILGLNFLKLPLEMIILWVSIEICKQNFDDSSYFSLKKLGKVHR